MQNGVGINLNKYRNEAKLANKPRILLASRLLWSKGVGDYVEAIKILNKKQNSFIFLLAGFSDLENPDHIKEKFIKEWEDKKLLVFLGWVEDMPKLLSSIDIFCLPSYYGEGVPKSLIEAIASSIPCITTDTPGCRITVQNNENGFLVPIMNPKEIAKSIENLIAMNALYRPGPLEYIPEFIDRKHGRKEIVYDLDVMEGKLKETYGITVYQEQVMLLSQELAGFSKGQADMLRKGMGKKNKDIIDELKKIDCIIHLAGCKLVCLEKKKYIILTLSL